MRSQHMEKIAELQSELSRARWSYWLQHIVFSWQWCFLILSTIGFTWIWLRLLDDGRRPAILINGGIALVFCILADTLGGELQLWDYPYMILPWGPRIICIDWMIAMSSMLVYQYCSRWTSFLLVSAGVATVFAFVFEPLAVAIRIYLEYAWNSWYSLPIYFASMCGFKAAADRLVPRSKFREN